MIDVIKKYIVSKIKIIPGLFELLIKIKNKK